MSERCQHVISLCLTVALAVGIAPCVYSQVSKRIDAKDHLLLNPHWSILVAEVLNVRGGRTKGNPPAATVKVLKTFRGNICLGTVVEAFWRPANGPSDHMEWRPGDGTAPHEWYKRSPKTEWFEKTFEPPAPKQVVLLFALEIERNGKLTLTVDGTYEDSSENDETVVEHMVAPERAQFVQLPLFLVLTFSPLIGLAVYFLARLRRDRGLLLIVWAYPAIMLALYAYYESGISGATDIRLDLILISLGTGLTLVLWLLFAAVTLFCRSSGDPNR